MKSKKEREKERERTLEIVVDIELIGLDGLDMGNERESDARFLNLSI